MDSLIVIFGRELTGREDETGNALIANAMKAA
jgi:hypothetical protein